MVQSMYEDVTTRVNGRDSKAFEVKFGVHQESVLSLTTFVIVWEASSREFREGMERERRRDASKLEWDKGYEMWGKIWIDRKLRKVVM